MEKVDVAALGGFPGGEFFLPRGNFWGGDMEADIAAIRDSVAVIQWCCTVLAFTLVPWVGMYLFRLTIIARDRFNKRVLALGFALLLSSQAQAACDCTDWGKCPLGGGGNDWFALVNQVICLGGGVSDHATDCLGGVQRNVKKVTMNFRGRRVAGQNRADDLSLEYVLFIEVGANPAMYSGFTFFYHMNEDKTDPDWFYRWNQFFPGCADCSQCQNICANCLYCTIIDAFIGGVLTEWPEGVSSTDMFVRAALAMGNYAPGVGRCGAVLVDSDGDGLADCVQGIGNCQPPRDTDGDGIPDSDDPDDDGDGVPDGQDPDDDGDGVPDEDDPDSDDDGDGIPNPNDPDDDGDGVPDGQDPDHPDGMNPDADGDGIPDADDPDDDGDGVPDTVDPDSDNDGDGIPNGQDPDANGNGIPDEEENPDGGGDGDGDGDGDGEDPDEEEPGTRCVEFEELFRAIGLRVMGFEGLFFEDKWHEWGDAQGGGMRVPYVNPTALVGWAWETSWLEIRPDGTMTVPGHGTFAIQGWDYMASILHVAFSAWLVITFAQAFFVLAFGHSGG